MDTAAREHARATPANLYRRGDGGIWYGRFSVKGELQRISLQTSDVREARARLKAIKTEAQRHAFGIRAAKQWQDAVIAYATGVLDTGGLKPATAKRYRVSLHQLDPHFAGKRLPDITTAEIAAYVEARQKAGASNATIRRDLTALSRVLAYAKHAGMTDANAAQSFERGMIRERRPPITAPSDAAIATASDGVAQSHPELAALIRFLRATGMRAGEALRARWADMHGSNLTIIETKNGRSRTIAVSPDVLPDRGDGRLFPGLPVDTGALASMWQWARRKLPAECRFHLHSLRHAHAIAQIRAGCDIYDLSRRLGHSSVAVTEIYLGYRPAGRA